MARPPAAPPRPPGPPEELTTVLRLLMAPPAGLDVLIRTADANSLPWDEFRRRPMPPGVPPETAWQVLRLQRHSGSRPLPLRTPGGEVFSYRLPPALQELVHRITRGIASNPAGAEQRMPDDDYARFVVTSLMEEAIASSQIEGATTTRLVAKEMLRTGRAPRTHSERMIVNNYLALQEVKERLREPLSQELLCRLQESITRGTLDRKEAEGRFRTTDDIKVFDSDQELVHDPPPAAQLPERIQRLCDFANGRHQDEFVDPLVRASTLHYWLAYEHPFEDGNGRTARLLLYWSLLRDGYRIAEFLSISGQIKKAFARYYRAFLHVKTDGLDLTYFLANDLRAIDIAIRDWWTYFRTQRQEAERLAQRLHALAGLNHRQRALISHALRHPQTVYTVRGHATSHAVTAPTARADLLDLVAGGQLRQLTRRKPAEFAAAPDLRSRLKETT